MKRNPLLIVVSAPSGAGKSTLCDRLIERVPGMSYSVSCTTRAPRGTEENHLHYHFLSEEEFAVRLKNGEFLEYATVHGNSYGTLKATVQETLTKGQDLILDIDVQGAAQIRAACAALPVDDPVRKGFVDLFITPPSMEELRRRLCGRGTDAAEVIEKRMNNAETEMSERGAYQHQLINEDLDEALEKLERMLERERKKRSGGCQNDFLANLSCV